MARNVCNRKAENTACILKAEVPTLKMVAMVSPKHRYPPTRLYGVAAQNTTMLIGSVPSEYQYTVIFLCLSVSARTGYHSCFTVRSLRFETRPEDRLFLLRVS
jgi:hypothetical protein